MRGGCHLFPTFQATRLSSTSASIAAKWQSFRMPFVIGHRSSFLCERLLAPTLCALAPLALSLSLFPSHLLLSLSSCMLMQTQKR